MEAIQEEKRMKVCVLAYNSVLSDARILKEADSLARAGHSVNIIGFSDQRHFESQTLSGGVVVNLLPFLLRSASAAPVKWWQRTRLKLAVVSLLAAIVMALLIGEFGYPNWPIYAFIIFGVLLGIINKFLYPLLDVVPKARLLTRRVRTYIARHLKQKALVQAAKELAVDIVHCHDLLTLPAGIAIACKKRALLVWDAHEIYEEVAQASAWQQQLSRRILQASQKSVNAFITINDSIAGFYRENYPALPPAVIVKNATIKAHDLHPDGRLYDAAGLPKTQKIVLYQGGFAEKRGLHDLVAAARFLGPEWTLIMMGWGNIEKDLRAIGNQVLKATSSRAVPAVCFLPGVPQAELALWTADARVGVIPYERVGLNHLYCTPNKLWEYPNAGVPILCSPLVEMSKVIDQYNVGWLLPDAASPEAIAATINKLSEPEIARAKSACIEYMQQENWAVYERRLLALYDDLAARIQEQQAVLLAN
jgi:glycosyltransferase involved in cell wall biosynthesis